MRSIFKTVAVVLASLVVLAAPSFALSDAEYKKLMKDKNFARADKTLSREWDRAKKLFPKTKEGQAAYKLLLDNQREWVRNGRDAEAKEIMENTGYSRTVAYTMATLSRSEKIPAIAQMYLEDAAPKKAPKKTASKPKEITTPKPRKETPKPKKEEPQTESGRRKAAGDWHDTYPDTGFCVGSSVRLREDPDTESEIVGRLNEGSMVIVLGETSVDGEKWYSVDNPVQEGTAWVFGKYIDTYKGYEIGTPVYNTYIQILLNFGVNPEKAKVLLGDPDRELEDDPFVDPANRKMHLDILEYPDLQLQYREKRLSRVEVWKSGLAFGGIQVGDPVSKLNDALGEPVIGENGTWRYEGDPRTVLLFEVENDEITRMTWEEYID
ncbi:MAG: SH3 domain-containing protein [Synergistaceae bacterium]|nr:SH3 domain-containing protein [Synergistaceae bacterium]